MTNTFVDLGDNDSFTLINSGILMKKSKLYSRDMLPADSVEHEDTKIDTGLHTLMQIQTGTTSIKLSTRVIHATLPKLTLPFHRYMFNDSESSCVELTIINKEVDPCEVYYGDKYLFTIPSSDPYHYNSSAKVILSPHSISYHFFKCRLINL